MDNKVKGKANKQAGDNPSGKGNNEIVNKIKSKKISKESSKPENN